MGHLNFWEGDFDRSGLHTIWVNAPSSPLHELTTVTLTNELGQHFTDSMVIGYNVEFHRMLKWAVVLSISLATLLILS